MTPSLAGTIVAIVALVATIWNGLATRRHNRLSVRPLLRIDWTFEDGPLEAILRNAGIGPAFIGGVSVYVDALKVELPFPESVRAALVAAGIAERCTGYNVFPGTALAAGEEFVLASLPNTAAIEKVDLEKIANSLRRIRFVVPYRSVYDEPFQTTSQPQLIVR
jgi:hypothetical protein